MILLNSFIISLTIIGFHLIIEYLLDHFFRLTLDECYDKFSGKWQMTIIKPLFTCPLCMTSVWGTSLYFLMYGYFDLQCYVFTIGLVGLSNYLINKHLL